MLFNLTIEEDSKKAALKTEKYLAGRQKKGRQDENVNVWIDQQPDDWETRIKTYRYTVTGVHVPSDATFEFSVEVDSELDEDAVFDLFAKGPQGWDINFKPA